MKKEAGRTNTPQAQEKPQRRILEFFESLRRGIKIKRKKTTEIEWSFKGSDD